MIMIVLIKQNWSSINYQLSNDHLPDQITWEWERCPIVAPQDAQAGSIYFQIAFYPFLFYIFLHRFQMLHILSCSTIFTSFPNTSHLIFSTWILLPINIIILLVTSSSSSMGSSLSRSVKTVRGFFLPNHDLCLLSFVFISWDFRLYNF